MNDPIGTTTPAPEDTAPPLAGEQRLGTVALQAFRIIERGFLVVVAVLTVCAAGLEIWRVIETRQIDLADILLMFLYTEVIGMIAVFYSGGSSPYIYPIFIAVTALARLIVLQGKDMAPENILFEAGAILLLAIAVVVLSHTRSS